MSAQFEEAHPDKVAAPKKPPQLITVLVPAVAGVLAAFITVFPQLRNKDAAIGDLQQQVTQLKSNLLAEPSAKPPAEAPKTSITGRLLDRSGKRPIGWAEVYLVPQNKPKLIGRTEEDGTFRFPDMPDQQQYRIIVLNSETGKISMGNLDADIRETKLDGAWVKYDVKK